MARAVIKLQASVPYESSLERLRSAGYKVTNARTAVLRALFENDGHLTSTEVLEHVAAMDDSVSRASVFRALDLLTSLAIIRPTFLEPRTPTYVLMSADGHHSHMICTHCGHVIELEDCHVDELGDQLATQHGYRVTGHLLEFYGVCEGCDAHE